MDDLISKFLIFNRISFNFIKSNQISKYLIDAIFDKFNNAGIFNSVKI